MNFCVFGAGNIGVLTSYFLKGFDVTLFSRRASYCEAKEYKILFPDNNRVSFQVMTCGLKSSMTCDIGIFASKAYEVKEYVDEFEGTYREGISLQNGYGSWETISLKAELKRAFPVVVTYGVRRDDDTFVVSGEGAYYIGGFRGLRPKYEEELSMALQKGGANVVRVKDIEEYVWLKLIVNCVTNPITALLGVPNGFVLDNSNLWQLASNIIKEIAMVISREEVSLSVDPEDYVKEVLTRTRFNYSSMLQDVVRGRRTEIDFMNGFIVSKAKAYGISVPYNESLYYLIKALEDKVRKIHDRKNNCEKDIENEERE